tara:strand:+ start:179 stop:415 length:237 start_codon:yes stop_codon:yes gene_type:complete
MKKLYKSYTSGKVKLILFEATCLGYKRTQRMFGIKETTFSELEDWLRQSKKHSIGIIFEDGSKLSFTTDSMHPCSQFK